MYVLYDIQPRCMEVTVNDTNTGDFEMYHHCAHQSACESKGCTTNGAGVTTCVSCELGVDGVDFKCDNPSPQPPSRDCAANQDLQCFSCMTATSDEDCYKNGEFKTCAMPQVNVVG